MSAGQGKRPERPVAGDHVHVGRISTVTTIVVLTVIVMVFYTLQTVLLPFVFSGIVAYVSAPLLDHAAERTGLPRSLFATCLFLLFVSIAGLFGFIGLPPLAAEFSKIVTDTQGTVGNLVREALGDRTIALFGKSMNANEVTETAVSAVRDWIVAPGRIAQFGGATFAAGFGLIVTLVLLFYFLVGGRQILSGLLRLVPPNERPLVLRIWSYLDPVLKRYFIGVACVVAYATLAAYVGLGLILHIPHAGFVAVLTGILEMIPVVGPGAAAIIAGLVAIRYATGLGSIIGYAIYAAALRLSIDQFFGPIALGTAAKLHPAVIIFCFFAGGALFGVAGVILSVPVALTVKVTLSVLYDEPQSSDI